MKTKPGKDLTLSSLYRLIRQLFEKALQRNNLPFFNDKKYHRTSAVWFPEKHGTVELVNRLTGEVRIFFETKHYRSAIF